MGRLILAPSEVRFISKTINCEFQNGFNLNDAVEAITCGFLCQDDFLDIKVVYKDGKYYSLDNRRLYVFRAAQCNGALDEISVNIVPLNRLRWNKFTTKNDGMCVRVRGDKTLDHTSCMF